MVNVTSLLAKAGSTVGFSFGVRAWTEMEIRCIKGMYRLKLISSAGIKGLRLITNSYSFSRQWHIMHTVIHAVMSQPSLVSNEK